jgi:hypothetical protein
MVELKFVVVVEEQDKEQVQDMDEDMVEEQGMIEDLELVQEMEIVVVGVLLAIADKVASMAHQLLAMNASYQLVELDRRSHRRTDS